MDELRRIRKERGWSQQRLADRANVDKVTIVHIEGGKVSPKVETLEKLAAALKVDLADLFPKAQAPLFQELPDPGTQEQRRVVWESAVEDARRLRETGRDRLEELLAAWHASKERGEALDARRAYLDEMGELLQEAYDARPTLFQAMSYERLPEQWPELGEADKFYRELWSLVESAGLSIRAGNAQQERPKAVEEPEAA
jgi:transcriptional regulator with XRE-family HTH domain